MQVKYVGTDGDNSYLIISDKTVLIECTKKENKSIHLANLSSALGKKTLDYILLNHTSPDNTGSLEGVMSAYPDAVVLSSAAGIKNISSQLNCDFEYEITKDESDLDIGEGNSIRFLNLPNLPWTDTMASLCGGMLFCGSIFNSSKDYYKNNISIFKGFARTAIERLKAYDIKKIMPVCGDEITDIKTVFEEYISEDKCEEFIALIYSSNYGFTKEMAQVILKTASEEINIKMFDADKNSDDEITEAINQSSAFIIGTTTVNRNAPESIWRTIGNIDMVNKKNTPCFVFGSCGWSGEGVYLAEKVLKALNMRIFKKPFVVNFKMSDEEKENLITHTKKFVEFVKNKGE